MRGQGRGNGDTERVGEVVELRVELSEAEHIRCLCQSTLHRHYMLCYKYEGLGEEGGIDDHSAHTLPRFPPNETSELLTL